MAEKKKSAKSVKKDGPQDSVVGFVAAKDDMRHGRRGIFVGDGDYRYEALFRQMYELQFFRQSPEDAVTAKHEQGRSAGERRRVYKFVTIPPESVRPKVKSSDGFPLGFHVVDDPGHIGRIHCTGSTETSVLCEVQRKLRLLGKLEKLPVPEAEELKALKAQDASLVISADTHKIWQGAIPKGTAEDDKPAAWKAVFAPNAVEPFGVGFRISEVANMRRGDVSNSLHDIKKKKVKNETTGEEEEKMTMAGHGIYIWDRRVTPKGEVEYQQLSSQWHHTDGIGVNGVTNSSEETTRVGGIWRPNDLAWAEKALRDRHDGWVDSDALEAGIGRFYRQFPYWPLAVVAGPANPGASSAETVPPDFSAEADPGAPELDGGGVLVGVQSIAGRIQGHKDYALVDAYYRAPSRDGLYPISVNRAWHGGIHLASGAQPVHAMSDGVIIAARMPKKDDKKAPSSGFVLIRHEADIDGDPVTFYCLYMHLDPTQTGASLMSSRWLWRVRTALDPVSLGQRKKLEAGEVVLLADPIAAGEIVGHVGGGQSPFLHWEIFSKGKRIDVKVEKEGLVEIKDPKGKLFFDAASQDAAKDLMKKIAGAAGEVAATDGVITKDEIVALHASAETDQALKWQLRRVAVEHKSEWAKDTDWTVLPDERARWGFTSEAEVEEIRTESRRLAFWDDKLSKHGKGAALGDTTIWTYHPVAFTRWLAEKVGDDPKGKQKVQDVKSFLEGAAKDAEAGVSILDDEDYLEWTVPKGERELLDASFKPTGLVLEKSFLAKGVHTAEDGTKYCKALFWVRVDPPPPPKPPKPPKKGKKGEAAAPAPDPQPILRCLRDEDGGPGSARYGCKLRGVVPPGPVVTTETKKAKVEKTKVTGYVRMGDDTKHGHA